MDSMNKVQQGIFDMILENVVAVDIVGVTGKTERKLTCVAALKFLTECPPVVDRPGAFAKLLSGRRPAVHQARRRRTRSARTTTPYSKSLKPTPGTPRLTPSSPKVR